MWCTSIFLPQTSEGSVDGEGFVAYALQTSAGTVHLRVGHHDVTTPVCDLEQTQQDVIPGSLRHVRTPAKRVKFGYLQNGRA